MSLFKLQTLVDDRQGHRPGFTAFGRNVSRTPHALGVKQHCSLGEKGDSQRGDRPVVSMQCAESVARGLHEICRIFTHLH